jgi:hypothetical protein
MISPPPAPAAEVFVLTRIRRHDKLRHGTKVTDAEGIIAAPADASTPCYTDRKPTFRMLCVTYTDQKRPPRENQHQLALRKTICVYSI